MTSLELGLLMTGILLVLVICGMRVAFATAFVGVTRSHYIFFTKAWF